MVIIPEYAKQSDLKKRGRKREKWEIYVQNAEEKIAQYKQKLATAKNDKVDVKLR